MAGAEGSRLTIADSAYAAAEKAHALVVVTEWDEFKTLDFRKLFDAMQKPAFVFDGRNILPHAALEALGFRVYAIGK
ncbi:MAG TPA: UDP binding domain-containing protein [Opitutaceae bacterium]|nr:UDP binding domain-containing protein [Opitutaceae bacterium]